MSTSLNPDCRTIQQPEVEASQSLDLKTLKKCANDPWLQIGTTENSLGEKGKTLAGPGPMLPFQPSTYTIDRSSNASSTMRQPAEISQPSTYTIDRSSSASSTMRQPAEISHDTPIDLLPAEISHDTPIDLLPTPLSSLQSGNIGYESSDDSKTLSQPTDDFHGIENLLLTPLDFVQMDSIVNEERGGSSIEYIMRAYRLNSADPSGSRHCSIAFKMLAELFLIAKVIAGKAHFGQMNGDGNLASMLSSTLRNLQNLKENQVDITIQIARMEACKWIYPYMRRQNRIVTCHPQCIREIPRRVNHEGKFYLPPSDIRIVAIAEAWGLDINQVISLFVNDRKRVVRNDPVLKENLKSHFSTEVTQILSDWKSINPGRRPDSEQKNALAGKTGKTQLQVENWFNNHGRDRSKKRSQATD